MADTVLRGTATGAIPPTSGNPAAITRDGQGRFAVAYDASQTEVAWWEDVAPQALSTGTLTAVIHYRMASATSGGVAFIVNVEALTPGDSVDMDSADSFDSDNTGTDTVPGTAGYPDSVSVTVTNKDSIAAGDAVRIKISRDHDHASDTATGDCYLTGWEIQEA